MALASSIPARRDRPQPAPPRCAAGSAAGCPRPARSSLVDGAAAVKVSLRLPGGANNVSQAAWRCYVYNLTMSLTCHGRSSFEAAARARRGLACASPPPISNTQYHTIQQHRDCVFEPPYLTCASPPPSTCGRAEVGFCSGQGARRPGGRPSQSLSPPPASHCSLNTACCVAC